MPFGTSLYYTTLAREAYEESRTEGQPPFAGLSDEEKAALINAVVNEQRQEQVMAVKGEKKQKKGKNAA